ncbi:MULTISPECIES: hypothetical protein [unclassified Pseudoclavibacter]|mgnify:CR=1 FL=1|uniref:hypothetical protein n=1 Tax=unclassified Pseudoclavibacter TaxID=2615177 RepID=UPI0012F29A48|nr:MULTISPECIES: hypothetical protein [unclassified Pseudoclavibacter]MBF4457622.1 hypothetical protein [Pseudoclavibacter sp. VKM Ac-2867]VXB02461.1 hypothetical protein PSCLAVI8L_100148 [Pseudoclavibacter sp. 8L]
MPPISVHERAFLTWLAIFPLVSLVGALLASIASTWPALLATALVTAIVVVLAVYLVVPQLTKLYLRVLRRRQEPDAAVRARPQIEPNA